MTNNRKDDHIQLALNQYEENQRQDSVFKDCHFVHQSIPKLNLSDIDLTTECLGYSFSSPFFINAMTGGSKRAYQINQKLGVIAKECDLAIATGSMSPALQDAKQIDSFTIIRKSHPNGFIIANLGMDKTLKDAQFVCQTMQANALQVHLNTCQELIMPEGDRKFQNVYANLKMISKHIEVPLIVKEVGFGMSYETIEELEQLGAYAIDISGRGGTNFAQIENSRRVNQDYSYLTHWGLTSPISLLEAVAARKQVEIIASGGIKTALDIVTSLALGASMVGLSGYFLNAVNTQSVEDVIHQVKTLKMQVKQIMLLLNCPNIAALQRSQIVISGETAHWCQCRQIPYRYLAKRK